MISDLDTLLQNLLVNNLPAMTPPLNISFATPDSQFPGSAVLPIIDLFLYDIRENRELRSNEWLIDRQGASAVKRRSPVRVDFSYLITTWVTTGKTSTQDEHDLLGEVMKILLCYPTLPASLLPKGLQDQVFDPLTATLHAGYLQSVAEFWQALGGRPRAALNYTVTLCVSAQPPVDAEKPVTGVKITLDQGVEGA